MAVAAEPPLQPPHGPFVAALKDALGAALLALGLSVPILALRTEQNMSNELVLQPRWGYVAVAVAAGVRRRACSTCSRRRMPERARRRTARRGPPSAARRRVSPSAA